MLIGMMHDEKIQLRVSRIPQQRRTHISKSTTARYVRIRSIWLFYRMNAIKIQSKCRGLLLIFGLFFLMFSSVAQAQEETVSAEGVARILQGNTDIARDNAIVDAQRKAVEQAVGVLMSSESLVENYELLSDRILTQSTGYIKNYQLIDERKDGDDYRVTIEAVVGMGDLEQDVQAIQHLIQQKGNPRMMFLVTEDINGLRTAGFASADLSQAESTLTQIFLDAGFEVVDSEMVAQNINRDVALKALEGDSAAASALAQQYGADVIITVKASANSGAKILDTNMKTHQAAMTAKVVRADTAQLLSTAGEQAKQAHIDELAGGTAAVEKAAAQLAEKLIPKILEQWRQDVQGAATVQLMISKISFKQLKRFKEILNTEIRGVKAVNQRSFQSNIAKLDVEIQSSAEALADELMSKEFKGLSLDISGMTENRIDLVVQ
ncbi:MAG: hypothetical protein GY801_33255 [bacterium]|nr:hypothetical protein [bacterium]